LYFAWILAHLIFLRGIDHGFGYLVFLSVAVVLNDVLAYTAGRLFGKHKLAPHISPKKTWEGAVGGLFGSLLGVVVFKYAVPELTWNAALVSGVIIGVTSPLGDLIVSVIKRDMAVKDTGALIPGHGGLLDRCDSLIFATPAFYYFIILAQRLGV
jgi:phosphatidate cytidylyltransferase